MGNRHPMGLQGAGTHPKDMGRALSVGLRRGNGWKDIRSFQLQNQLQGRLYGRDGVKSLIPFAVALWGLTNPCAPQQYSEGISAWRAGAQGGEAGIPEPGACCLHCAESGPLDLQFPGSSGDRSPTPGVPQSPGSPGLPAAQGKVHQRLPEISLLGHGGIKGGNRLSPGHSGGAQCQGGDSVLRALGTGRLVVDAGD